MLIRGLGCLLEAFHLATSQAERVRVVEAIASHQDLAKLARDVGRVQGLRECDLDDFVQEAIGWLLEGKSKVASKMEEDRRWQKDPKGFFWRLLRNSNLRRKVIGRKRKRNLSYCSEAWSFSEPESPCQVLAEVERRELQVMVRQAVDRLEGVNREPLQLHYMEGLSSAEIAVELHITEVAVRKRVLRGINCLRRSLNPQ